MQELLKLVSEGDKRLLNIMLGLMTDEIENAFKRFIKKN